MGEEGQKSRKEEAINSGNEDDRVEPELCDHLLVVVFRVVEN